MSQAGSEVPEPAPGRRRRRWWVFRIAMLLAIVAGQEALFRFLFPLPDAEGFNRVRYQEMARTHANYRGTMARGFVYDRLLLESAPDGFSAIHNLNLRGFRGPDFAIKPDPNRRRILVIGDSVTEGMGADDSRSFPAIWSRLLARDGIPAEVVNLGVMGANLPYLWLLVRDATPLLKPTDVVVMLYANDLPAPSYDEASFNISGPEFPLATVPWWRPRLAVLTWRAIIEKPIYRRWPNPLGAFFGPVPDSTNPWSGEDKKRPDDLAEPLYQAMVAGKLNPFVYFQAKQMPGALRYNFAEGGSPRAFLEHMAGVCKRNGARLIVAYTPFCGVVHKRYAPALIDLGMDPAAAEALPTDPKYRSQNRVLTEVCAELGLPLIDVTEALEAAEAAGKPQYWRYDSHPNPDGYATIAGRLHAAWRALTDGRATPPARPM